MYKFLNRPFPVTVLGGAIVFLISTSVQDHYWKTQQSFLIEQTRRVHRIDFTYAAEEEIIRALGKRLTGIAVVVGAHRAKQKTQQYREVIDISNKSKREWDDQVEVLRMKVSTYFPGEKILKSWDSLINELDTFDQTVTDFNDKFSTLGKCRICSGGETAKTAKRHKKEHEDALDVAEGTIDQLEEHLNQFARDMNDFLDKVERPSSN